MAGADPGARIGELLDRLGREAGPQARETADELVRSVVEFYGEGLARTVRLLRSAPAGSDPLAVLTADELVGDLLILHDLHPEDTMTRVGRALDKVRPYLGSHAGDVEVAGLDTEAAEGPVLRLRLCGSCDGCPSSTQTVRWTIEEVVARLAPEIAHIEVEGVTEAPDRQPLLQIQPRPPADAPGAPPPPAAAPEPPHWHTLAAPALPAHDHATRVADVEGNALLLVRLPGNLYAYRDRCPGCGADLRTAPLDGEFLSCAGCAARFDVRHAGRGERSHLEPLPLLEEEGAVRVALPELLGAGP
ncbi:MULTISPECIES: NifU family protein [Streptomyces]|uniref:NifU family protein n=1 Tax=Streptomyces TaxID=1883 RepID=UPI00164666E5|nr:MULTISPECIES: NifU family protein [Streptomyces]MBT3074961.1 NifU family protein [Streptomyces sp. COG21]MBT3082014.1 NifU family protein [Streptomyces sp. COG20]MBT3086294.1 NifU family protein [Streptomyces sp. CYG21]MBT3096587.1 NifU family protein [Streptomyces sp. CBG30]MBT3103786.1 NifU family protein [Streptomyces sp. COG19]